MSDAKVIQFGNAGALYVGPDAEICQHCAAIVAIYERFTRSRVGVAEAYNDACIRIERRAEVVAAIPAITPAGIRAKAEAILPLAAVGMSGYGERILSASLARDLLAQGDMP